jgi:hypothetical protein
VTVPSPHRVLASFDGFDPEAGQTLLEPERDEPGYWTGCPGVLYEQGAGRFLMTYRQRRPRGHDSERGWRCAIAESTDGVAWRDIWEVRKSELASSSMERFSLLPAPSGGYLLYISYVDPSDNRWRVDVIAADTPDAFDVAQRKPALTAADTGSEGVKDPYALRVGPSVQLLVSFSAARDLNDAQRARAHATADIYTTGVGVFPTGLASSLDGLNFNWHGRVLDVGTRWDTYQTRLNSAIDIGGWYLGFYDGSGSERDNYEERTGVALSVDLQHWLRLSVDEPWLKSPHASGSLRYLDAVAVDNEWFAFYEYARASGAHELRLSRLPMHSAA